MGPYGAANLTAGGTDNGYTQNPYLFKADIQDRATGLVKFGQRWYNPTTGAWTQQDTLDVPLDPASANRYAFAGGDPINGNDPNGTVVTTISATVCAGLCATVGASFDQSGMWAETVGGGAGAGASIGVSSSSDRYLETGADAQAGCSIGPFGASYDSSNDWSYSTATSLSSGECEIGLEENYVW